MLATPEARKKWTEIRTNEVECTGRERQRTKHAWLYSDSPEGLNGKLLTTLGSQHRLLPLVPFTGTLLRVGKLSELVS